MIEARTVSEPGTTSNIQELQKYSGCKCTTSFICDLHNKNIRWEYTTGYIDYAKTTKKNG